MKPASCTSKMNSSGTSSVDALSALTETVREQQETISMMQVQIDLQNEKIQLLQKEVRYNTSTKVIIRPLNFGLATTTDDRF